MNAPTRTMLVVNYKSHHIPVPVLSSILCTIFLLLSFLLFILISIKIQHFDLSVVLRFY